MVKFYKIHQVLLHNHFSYNSRTKLRCTFAIINTTMQAPQNITIISLSIEGIWSILVHLLSQNFYTIFTQISTYRSTRKQKQNTLMKPSANYAPAICKWKGKKMNRIRCINLKYSHNGKEIIVFIFQPRFSTQASRPTKTIFFEEVEKRTKCLRFCHCMCTRNGNGEKQQKGNVPLVPFIAAMSLSKCPNAVL